MSIIKKMRKQKALLWTPTTNDGYGGHTYNDAIIIDCRWEDIVMEISLLEGNKVDSKATVYVDRDIETGSYLALFDSGIDITANPEKIKGAFKVLRFEKLPNIKNTEYLRTIYL